MGWSSTGVRPAFLAGSGGGVGDEVDREVAEEEAVIEVCTVILLRGGGRGGGAMGGRGDEGG